MSEGDNAYIDFSVNPELQYFNNKQVEVKELSKTFPEDMYRYCVCLNQRITIAPGVPLGRAKEPINGDAEEISVSSFSRPKEKSLVIVLC